MKKINYQKYITAIALIALMASCKKSFLERTPEDAIVDENFYQTSEQVLAGTAPLYNLVWFAYNDKASHGIGDGRGGVLFSGSYQIENIQMKSTATTNEVNTSWQSFFNTVAQSNMVIDNIQKYAGSGVPDNIKQYAIAEGRFMRAVAYSYLVQNFGAVPIIENNNTLLQDTTIARNTIESIWQFITTELRMAADNLPTTALQTGIL